MGKIKNGLTNGFTKSVGTVTGVKYRGMDLMKSKRKKSSKKPTSKQEAQTSNFGSVSKLLSKFKKPINEGYNRKKGVETPMNLAIKNNLKHLSVDADQKMEFNYSKLTFSSGGGEMAWAPAAFFESEGKIRVTWEMSSVCDEKRIGKDTAHIVYYDVTDNMSIYTPGTVKRGELTSTKVLKCLAGNLFHIWIFFVSPDGKTISNTAYMGSGRVLG